MNAFYPTAFENASSSKTLLRLSALFFSPKRRNAWIVLICLVIGGNLVLMLS
jgi:hypothetical protein